MTQYQKFKEECRDEISKMREDTDLLEKTRDWIDSANSMKYSYHFEWLGRPIIQYPQDIVAMQELIWLVKPDLIIETGIAHGGSLIMSASMLVLIDYCEAVEGGTTLYPQATRRRVVGVDIDIREHNRKAIERHPFSNLIDMIQGSSVSPEVAVQIQEIAKDYQRVLVCLDSNHTHDHVLEELKLYAPLTSVDSYCVVFDTVIEDLPDDSFPSRPWGKGNNPKTAVWEYLKSHNEFEIDKEIENKLLITVAPDGFLKRVG